jgi:hypothetical protein
MSEMFTLRQFLDAGTNGFQNGRKMERERIMKDLEANEHIWRERVVLTALKALIKGEQNV